MHTGLSAGAGHVGKAVFIKHFLFGGKAHWLKYLPSRLLSVQHRASSLTSLYHNFCIYKTGVIIVTPCRAVGVKLVNTHKALELSN